ncbi:MAG: outer membrane protein assembly factor BamA [Proteobacteria bacterium]|nr:MAG: outer membrane protein assembly factor BamA [Pseudomonadota bacterium]
MKKIVLFVMFLSGLVAMEIKSIEFKGLIHLSKQMAKEISGLQIGDSFTYSKGDRAVKKLFAQGYFEDVWIEEEDGHIIINVQEKPTIALVELDGVGNDDEKNLKSIIGLKKGMVYDKPSMELAKKRIIEYFEAKGYFDTLVEEELEPLKEISSLKVLLKINRGEQVIIRDVKLSGAKNLDYDDVEDFIANKEREALGWMWGFHDGKLALPALPSDADRIKDEYLSRGYMDVQVSNPYLKLYNDNYDASINYHIKEGEKYTISSIGVYSENNEVNKEIKNEELADDLELEKGDTFNVKKLRKDIKNIETKIADLGYAFVKVYPNVKQDKEQNQVDIAYTILPGDKVKIRNIVIGGNRRTADSVVRREIQLGTGEFYNRTKLGQSVGLLKRSGYFSDVSMKEKRVSKDEVDIIVNVKEARTGSIRGGIGYGSAQGFVFDVGMSDKNIFGTGLHGNIDLRKSDDEIYGSIGLTNPRIFDSVYSLGISLYAKDNKQSSYDEVVKGGTITAGRRFGNYVHASLAYTLSETKLSNLSQSMIDAGYRNGKSIKSALRPSIVFNNTDDYYLPRRGVIASTSFEYAGLGGDEEFIKSISKFKAFYGLRDLIGYDLILRYKSRLRFAKDNGNLPINERLYLGGINSVRGFESRSIGPKNSKGKEYGGENSFNNSVELNFPLIDRLKIRGSFFYDYGMIGIDNFDDYTRSSAGFAIEWFSPIGAINLIFSKPIDPFDNDETSSFEFSVGTSF